MKKNLIIIIALAMAALNGFAQQKPEATVPQPQINAEKLNGKIDYNMDVSKLSLADLRILRNAPAAKQGFPFKDSYIRGVYATTSWYDSLMWKLDEKMPWDKFESSDSESYEAYYYRVINESKLIKYSKEEFAFMKRLQDRINALQQQNFKVPEGLRVNLQNVTNPLIVDNIDPLLSERLSQ